MSTPSFLIAQTVIVAIWILVNVLGLTKFDNPFILLNLAISLQVAYTAPLILLAQTRQTDRDAAHARADAEHREGLHTASEERVAVAADQRALLVEMLRQNTQLTETVKALTVRVEALTLEVHKYSGQFADWLRQLMLTAVRLPRLSRTTGPLGVHSTKGTTYKHGVKA